MTIAEGLTILFAVIGGAFILWQYRKSIKWRKTEFKLRTLDKYNEILNDFECRRGFKILDSVVTYIPITKEEKNLYFKANEGIEREFDSFVFENSMLERALRDHRKIEDISDGFNPKEMIIRSSLDKVFDMLGSIYYLLKETKGCRRKLDKGRIPSSIYYWIDIIANERDNEKRTIILNYIKTYNFSDVILLCEMFGFEIDTLV